MTLASGRNQFKEELIMEKTKKTKSIAEMSRLLKNGQDLSFQEFSDSLEGRSGKVTLLDRQEDGWLFRVDLDVSLEEYDQLVAAMQKLPS